MKIKRLELTAFGKFNNHVVDLDDGINLIYGENEAGKTTLQNFIKYMLYGIKGSKQIKGGGADNPKKYKPWKEAGFSGSMEYILDNGQQIRVNRNFEDNSARVFDSFFNDITNTFEIGKNKNLLFAQNHLGLNEVCFEKTVFVRQTGALIDDAGLSELKNILINLAQTGFEDVSLIKGEKALKEAIRKYSGNVKGSSTSLERINARLQELKSAKAEMQRERNQLILLEQELKEKFAHLERLNSFKDSINKSRAYLKLRKDLEDARFRESSLREILDRMKVLHDEQVSLLENTRESDTNNNCDLRLMELSDGELAQLVSEFKDYLDCYEELAASKERLCKKKDNMEELEGSLENISAFKYLGSDVDQEMLELNIKVDNIKKQINNIRGEVFSDSYAREKFYTTNKKKGLGIYNAAIIVSCVLVALSIVCFFINPLFLAGVPVFAIIAILIFILKSSYDKADLLVSEDNRHGSFHDDSNNEKHYEKDDLESELNKLEERIEDILLTVKAASVEEFFRLHALYKSNVSYFSDLNNDLSMLEEKLTSLEKQKAVSLSNIQEKLFAAGIDMEQESINKEYFDIVKNTYNKKASQYNGSSRYMASRKEDVKSEYKKCIEKAVQISGVNILDTIEDVNNELYKASQNITTIENDCDILLQNIRMTLLEGQLGHLLSQQSSLLELEETLEKEDRNNAEDIQNILLETKELETILKNSLKDEELQKIVEELNDLEASKEELEDTIFSLKTALETLNEASMEIHRDFVPALNEKTGHILNKMTGNKYDRLKLDDNLVLRLVEPETGAVVPADMLSCGTVEQVYLALRIAASELLMLKGETLPLMLDEIFSFYDHKRTIDTLKVLKDLSIKRQIILFTCKEWEMDTICQMYQNDVNVIKL
ncbi:ATP-binding protein [Pseudobacteroides cellulosolvens]|uniref:Rad50/SbcC-type AAA domain-containing protein n=1 Tax=Pseudobacteroides cellulosolvens ATCC 35603 = DSM 2933 TaxID=398512 RepID=A0A0L6JW26_9FIRM|nr:AAA family ATPase [Pseudobacteroides cellulosolvens]KNY29810.1 hypothetical protein Bccel_5087 [Pseudobacteroides cellulosolvens ATCC 35603 = DSM 2933]